MPEGFFNRMNPPTRARDLLTAVVSVGIRFERLALKMSSTRAGRPRRVMDLFTVLKESTFNTSMAPSAQSTDELGGMLPQLLDDVDTLLVLLLSATARSHKPRIGLPIGTYVLNALKP